MTQAQPRERIVLASKTRRLDVPALASSISAVHARIERHGGDHRFLGKDGERLARSARSFVSRVQDEVAEATLPFESPPRQIRPNPTRQMVADAAVATVNGISATRKAAASYVAPIADPRLRLNLREVVPSILGEALKRDLSRLDVKALPAAREAGRRALDIVRLATGKARNDLDQVRSRLAPLAKFTQGATVLPAGKASPAGTARVLRSLAVAAVVGSVSFGVVGSAWGQGSGGRLSVAAQAPEMSIDDLFGASFGGAVRAPSVPGMGTGASSPAVAAPSVAAPRASVQAPLPQRVPSLAEADRMRQSAAPEVTIRAGTTDFSDVRTAPSRAFLEIASATAGTATGNYKDASGRLDSLVVLGVTCMRGQSRIRDCNAELEGVTLDFVNGVHRAVMKPLAGVSTVDRVVAEETPGGGLRILDKDAYSIVMHEARASQVAEMREAAGEEDPGEEVANEAGAPRP